MWTDELFRSGLFTSGNQENRSNSGFSVGVCGADTGMLLLDTVRHGSEDEAFEFPPDRVIHCDIDDGRTPVVDRPTQLTEDQNPWSRSDDGESVVDQGGAGVEEADDAALNEDLNQVIRMIGLYQLVYRSGGFRLLSSSQLVDQGAINGE